MENNDSSTEFETLGALFRRLRMERSLDINDVAEETRIPPKTIRAIETDEYDRLPAPAFARGFYSLYAKMLDLDNDEIIRRYYEERSGNNTTKSSSKLPPPSWQQQKNIGTMAERPSLTPSSIIGSAVLVLILLVSGIFWYIGYNPATNISQWLRNFQEKPVVQEQTTTTGDQPDQELQTEDAEITEPSSEELSVVQDAVTVVEIGKYQLAAEFPYNTQVSVTIDGGETQHSLISADTIKTWNAEEKIVLELPPQTKAELYLNGEPFSLPAAINDKITISIPE
jgi:cytoskeletal protein RodZ